MILLLFGHFKPIRTNKIAYQVPCIFIYYEEMIVCFQNFGIKLLFLKHSKYVRSFNLGTLNWAFINPIRPSLFSRSPGLGGAQMPGCKNEGYHRPIEMKLCLSHYKHKSMNDAQFKYGSFSIFGDMTSQNFFLKKGRVIEFGYLPPGNVFNFKK